MVLNKKGVLMTMTAIIIGGVLITFFSIWQEPSLDEEYFSINTHISRTNDFLNNVESFIERRFVYEGWKALNKTAEHVSDQSYVDDFGEELKNCLMEETSYCGSSLNSSLKEWDEFVFDGLGIPLNTTVLDMEVYQDNPWYISINSTFNFYVSDPYATWNVTESLEVLIPIEGLNDPVYTMNNENSIISSRYDLNFYTEGGNFTKREFISRLSTIHRELKEKEDEGLRLYIAYPNAPSFLQRMEGNNSPDENGIVSLIRTENYSSMDFIHFSQDCPEDDFVKINFFSNSMNPGRRLVMGVNETDQDRGLDKMVITQDFANYINMTETHYTLASSCS